MIKNITLCLGLLTSITTISSSSDEFDDFMDVLKETTQIATKNKIDSDYAPGIISILRYSQLRKAGVRDLYEALKLIPNIDIILNDAGTNSITVRGIGGSLGSGKTKILINGIAQNTANTAVFNSNLPIEVIHRIEVLRGPASALYGEYAFNGVINIITKSDENSIFSKYTKLDKNNIVTTGATFFLEKDYLSIDGIISYENTKGLEPYTTDTIGTTGYAETSKNNKSLISNIKYKDIEINMALYSQKKGEFFGATKVLPDNDNKYNHIHKNSNIAISNNFTINDKFKIIPKFSYYKYTSGHELTKFNNTRTPYVYSYPYNEFVKKTLGVELFYTHKIHDILMGFESSKTDEINNKLTVKKYTLTGGNPPWIPPIAEHITTKPNETIHGRKVISGYFQDNIKINDKLITNLGLRLDKYDDKINTSLSRSFLPRVAVVYIKDKNNIFKAQYGKAFRPVTFLETLPMETKPTKSPKSETVHTLELQHNYKKNNLKFATTIFYSKLKNMLEIKRTMSEFWYENIKEDVVTKGIEFEFINQISIDYLLNYNLSYTDAYNNKTKDNLSNYSKVLSNLILTHRPYSSFSSTLYLRYTSSQKRALSDTRDDFKAQTSLDITFRYLPKSAYKGMDIVFGIKNILNETLKSPSSFEGISKDHIAAKRSYFAGIKYKF